MSSYDIFDNTVTLYNEDGNEIKYEIIEQLSYKGKQYFLLWNEDEDEDVFVVVTQINGQYKVVTDDDVLEQMNKRYKSGMSELLSVANGDTSVDEYMAMLHKFSDLRDEYDDLSTKIDNDLKEYDEMMNDFEPVVSTFDYDRYERKSQEYLFRQAKQAYENTDFVYALELFNEASQQGNEFAYAHVGIMYHQGDGCEKNDELALNAFREGARKGCPLAACWIAECYRLGYAVEADKEYASKLQAKSIKALEEMCKAGDTAALYFLGYNMIYGIGMEENDSASVRLLEIGDYKGDAACTVLLAECYLKGWGVSENKEIAFKKLDTLPKLKKRGSYLLGTCYYYGYGTEKDFVKAFQYFKKAAELGHGDAKDYLGDCYYKGQGVRQSYREAAKWYQDAVDNNGIGNSAHSLAFMYDKGEGVRTDKRRAIDYWKIAADKGITQAQRIISREYLSGEYLEKDNEKARRYMEMAAEQGDAEAQFYLGSYYISDLGFNDDQKCYEWFMKAAEQGYVEAEYAVGGCYEYELGVKQDFVLANRWYQIAIVDGHARAAYDLGMNYLEGRGTEKNNELGIQNLVIASERGILEASRELASRYHYGIPNYKGKDIFKDASEAKRLATIAVKDDSDGKAQALLAMIIEEDFNNIQESIEWYRKAVSNGNKEAMLRLSRIYVNTQTNCEDAVSMLSQLINENNGEAQFLYGICLEYGYGCTKDYFGANKYYRLAKSNGYKGKKPRRINDFLGKSSEKQISQSVNKPQNMMTITFPGIGGSIFFGSYQQDGKGNEKKPIEWIVLDKKEDKILLISKFGLDNKPYHSKYTAITWEKCSLRTWLNSSFISEAFNPQELSRIVETNVTADINYEYYGANPGNETKDKIFLLSIKEVNKYFKSDKFRVCRPTKYALTKLKSVYDWSSCYWWLRSPGQHNHNAAAVTIGGHVYNLGYNVHIAGDYYCHAVRPALWIVIDRY